MLYAYIVLIALGVDVTLLASFLLFARWAIPRYGAQAMRMAMRPPGPHISGPYRKD